MATVTKEQFERALQARLAASGFTPVADRFPLAGHELALLDYDAKVRTRGGRSFVVAVKRGDRFVREQLRSLTDQFFNALGRERNELKRKPTLLRGICIFAYETTPERDLIDFLLERVRPRTPMALIRSVPWFVDLGTAETRRPVLTTRPFPVGWIGEAIAAAKNGGPPGDA